MCFLLCYDILFFSLQNNRVDCFPFLCSYQSLSERCFLSSFKLPSGIFGSFGAYSQSLCFGPRNATFDFITEDKGAPRWDMLSGKQRDVNSLPGPTTEGSFPNLLSIILEKNRRQGSERHTKRKNRLCSKEKDVHGRVLTHIVMQWNNCINGPYPLQE